MELEAGLHEHDSGEDEEMEEERWRRLEKWAFRLRTMIQELLLEQITLLLDDLQEAVVRIHRQKDRFSKGQECLEPPPVSQVSGGGTARGESSKKAFQEQRKLERRMFETLQELVEDVKRRPRRQDGRATSDAAGARLGDEPLPDLASATRRFWVRCLEVPKSSPAYKKAYLVCVDEMMAISRLRDWIAECASFANEVLDEVTILCCQPGLIRASQGSLDVNVDDLLNLHDGPPENEAEEQGNEGALVQTKLDVEEGDKAETKSEASQGQGSMMGLVDATLGEKVDDDEGPPGNGDEEQGKQGTAIESVSEVRKGAGKEAEDSEGQGSVSSIS